MSRNLIRLINSMQTAKLNRRHFLGSLALGAIASGLHAEAAPTPLKGTAINHISYQSADYDKTRDFYVDLLGFQVSDEDDKQLYLWAGNRDMVISAKHSPPTTAPRMDHFGFTLEDYDMPTVKASLQDRGLPATLSQGDPHDPDGKNKTVFTRDPNGYTVQLCPSWDATGKPAPVVSHSPMKAVGINHFSYQCADYKKTLDFYVQLLDAKVSSDDGKQAYLWLGDSFVWFRNSTSGSARPLIDYFAWTVADWNANKVAAELKHRSLEAQIDPNGKSVLTKDLNGYPLLLCSKDFAKK